jgi:hypothetical protein
MMSFALVLGWVTHGSAPHSTFSPSRTRLALVSDFLPTTVPAFAPLLLSNL